MFYLLQVLVNTQRFTLTHLVETNLTSSSICIFLIKFVVPVLENNICVYYRQPCGAEMYRMCRPNGLAVYHQCLPGTYFTL